MRPSGAYAKTRGTYHTEAAGREALRLAHFEGPEYGKVWSRTLTLRKSYYADDTSHSEVLGGRNIPDHA